MVLIKAWIVFTWLFLFKMVCSSKNAAIRHLNMKFERLNRITDGLKRNVDDIWRAMSATVVNKQTDISNNTNQEETKPDDIMRLVNETVSDVKELRTEVEELAHIVKHGFQKEKKLSRDALKNMENHHDEFQTGVRKEIMDLKKWLQSFQDDVLKTMKLQTEEDNRKCQLLIQNITNDFTIKLDENSMDTAACYDKFDRVVQNVTVAERQMNDKIAHVKDVINEKLFQVAACITGWENFHGHCYFFSSVKKTWDEALEFCQSMNSYIVETDSDGEVNFVATKFKGKQVSFWVGANDRQEEGKFMWQNSEQLVPHAFWYKNEPNNSGGDENCAAFYSTTARDFFGKLNDDQCYNTRVFVCERSNSIFS